jgi:hypothetical protein
VRNLKVISAYYTVTFNNYDGTPLQSGLVAYGITPTPPSDPTKAATAQCTYTFAGWNTPIVAVAGAATYTATFDSVVNQYAITFNNYDGVELQSGNVAYGTVPTPPADPTKAATAQYTYTFAGWDAEVVAVTGAATYTATFDSIDATSVAGATFATTLQVYPNPTNNLLTIINDWKSGDKIEIYTLAGVLVHTFDVSVDTGTAFTIDISALPQGAYIVKVANKIVKIVKV